MSTSKYSEINFCKDTDFKPCQYAWCCSVSKRIDPKKPKLEKCPSLTFNLKTMKTICLGIEGKFIDNSKDNYKNTRNNNKQERHK